MKKFMFILNIVVGLLTTLSFGVGFLTILGNGYSGKVIPQDFYEATAMLLIVGYSLLLTLTVFTKDNS
jgi:hypothetical protein